MATVILLLRQQHFSPAGYTSACVLLPSGSGAALASALCVAFTHNCSETPETVSPTNEN